MELKRETGAGGRDLVVTIMLELHGFPRTQGNERMRFKAGPRETPTFKECMECNNHGGIEK